MTDNVSSFFRSAGADSARWITHPEPESYLEGEWESGEPGKRNSRDDSVHYKGMYLYGSCRLKQPKQHIAHARAYAAGVGIYRLYVDGSPAGKSLLSPAPTDYRKRVYYDEISLDSCLDYTIEDELHAVLFLGNGRHITLYGFGVPRGIVQIYIEYRDGSVQWFGTGSSWKAGNGPVQENSLFNGEVSDARIMMDAAAAGHPAELVEGYPLQPTQFPPITVDRRIVPIAMYRTENGFMYDFGQNFSGFSELRVQQRRGVVLTLHYAENMYEDGTLNPASNRAARACDTFICSGGQDCFSPISTYHGFRYVELRGYEGVPQPGSLTGLFVHSAVPSHGWFTCGSPDLNKVHEAVVWGQLSNLMGIPTDSPQRDERHGWLGDAHLSSEACLFNFDAGSFYEKFIQDIADTQREDGSITDTAPSFWMDKPADPAWGTAFLAISWNVYQHTGDPHLFQEYFPQYERYITFLRSQETDGLITRLGTFGDWCAPGLVTSLKTGLTFISTWYYHHDLLLMARISDILGYDGRAGFYRKEADRIAGRLNTVFWKNDHYASRDLSPWDAPDQTSQTLALAGGIVPDEQRESLGQLLDRLVRTESGEHIGTGIHGTRYLLEVLSELGFLDTALKIALQPTYPGWVYMIRSGATTLWERWEYVTSEGMNSHNHIMLGSIDSWFYRWVAGLSPALPGWKAVALFPGMFPELEYAAAGTGTPLGKTELSWIRAENQVLDIHIVIPPGSYGILGILDGFVLTESFSGISSTPSTSTEGFNLPCRRGVSFWRVEAGLHTIQLTRKSGKDGTP